MDRFGIIPFWGFAVLLAFFEVSAAEKVDVYTQKGFYI